MDYKEEYEAMVQRARELHEAGNFLTKKQMEIVCPELAESEDEKIRRTLVEYFGPSAQLDFIRGVPIKKIRDWLEKQKEQKPAEYLDKDKVYAIMTKLTNLSYSQLIPINSNEFKKLHEITCDVRSLLDYPIEQKYYPIEQKSAEWDKLQADFRNINEAFEDGKKEVVDNPEKYGLCRPAEWSEEDKEMIERLIRHTQEEFNELCNDRYGHQEIISDLKESCRERMDWLENRLKSLRPQPQWKPSEEQMEALKDAALTRGNKNLATLYDQLKKLI